MIPFKTAALFELDDMNPREEKETLQKENLDDFPFSS